jgi:hypothetical protein
MEYVVNDFKEGERRYSVSYSELKEFYNNFINLSDADFMKQLPEIIHFACIVSWFKNLPNDATIGDCGIVHELIHVMCNGNGNKYHFKKVRKQFKVMLQLI